MNDFIYGDEVLEFITHLDTERCMDTKASIPEALENNNEKEIEEILSEIKDEFSIDDDTAEEYLYAWGIWAKEKWEFSCVNCGCKIKVNRFLSSHGCVCGTKYDFPEWKKYVLDDFDGDYCLFEGKEIKFFDASSFLSNKYILEQLGVDKEVAIKALDIIKKFQMEIQ